MTFRLIRKPRLSSKAQYDEVRSLVRKNLLRFGDKIVRIFGDIVANWSHEPKFRKIVRVSAKKIELVVLIKNRDEILSAKYGGTIGKLWDWINEGTAEGGDYTISPRSDNERGLLSFVHGPYIPKTRATRPPSFGGPGSRRGPTLDRLSTTHPGIAERDFTGHVFDTQLKSFNNTVDDGYRRGFKSVEKKL